VGDPGLHRRRPARLHAGARRRGLTSTRFTALGFGALGLAAVCLALAAVTDVQELAAAALFLVGGVGIGVSVWRAGGAREWLAGIAGSAAILAAVVLVALVVQRL